MRNTLLAVSALAMSALAAPAFANVINIGTTGATITCSVSCQGFIGAGGLDSDPPPPAFNEPTGPGTLSNTSAQLYSGQPADEASEETRLETLVGGDVPGPGVKTEGSGDMFDSDALYIVFKIGAHAVFIKNTSGGSQTYTYSGVEGLGLSHITEFIPIPAAVWLMGAGLAGLGFASRRKRA
jgi:hypothetical protein